jgi:quercetin dioxygenase-like cupin family protein
MSKLRILMITLALLAPAVVVGARSSQAAPPGPTAPFEGHYPITVAAGDYDLVYLVLDFAPGASIPLHFHGGPAVVVGMDGVLTLRPDGAPEKTLRPGDVVNEKQGARHEMINTSPTTARILAGVLLPKGVDLTTIVPGPAAAPTHPGEHEAMPAGMPSTGSPAIGAAVWWPLLLLGLLCVLGGLRLLAVRRARR